MKKQILLILALLAPTFAYGGSDISVQIVPVATPPNGSPPSGSSPPPSSSGGVPSVPAGAQAAGFTTLVANYDFTGQYSSFYQTLSNWLDCAGASNPQWYNNPSFGNAAPCSAYSIVNDGGTNALQMSYLPSFASSGINTTEIDTANSSQVVGSAGLSIPQGIYTEALVRAPSASANACASSGCLFADYWAWPLGSSLTMEWDFVEIYNGGPAGGDISYTGNEGGGPGWPAVDTTQYHVYGVRITTDGQTGFARCDYLDNVLQACASMQDPSQYFTTRNELRLSLGPQSGTAPTAEQDFLIQWIHVWSCSGWATGQCNGTELTGAP